MIKKLIKRMLKMEAQETVSLADQLNAMLPDNRLDEDFDLDQNIFTLEDTLRLIVDGLLCTVMTARGQAITHFEVVTPQYLIAYWHNGYSKPIHPNNMHEFYVVP